MQTLVCVTLGQFKMPLGRWGGESSIPSTFLFYMELYSSCYEGRSWDTDKILSALVNLTGESSNKLYF